MIYKALARTSSYIISNKPIMYMQLITHNVFKAKNNQNSLKFLSTICINIINAPAKNNTNKCNKSFGKLPNAAMIKIPDII